MVFVLNADRKPLDPCHPARARQLLGKGQAAILRRYPFTVILKNQKTDPIVHEHRIKIDPGSKVTGIAILQGDRVVWAAELTHRGEQIKKALLQRRQNRHLRRSRTTRYRKPRFLNRRRQKDWLPPSLESRVANSLTWVGRLTRSCPIDSVSMELVKFDTQLLQNPEISGVEYQQGELQEYEVREYLLEKWDRKCAYCGKTDTPLEIEHIVPKSRGGTDRVSNLTLACHECNLKKNNLTAAEFGHPEVQVQAKQPLKDAATMNATRRRMCERLKSMNLPVETGSGGLTKHNRTRLALPKEHWIDAACVGWSTPEKLIWRTTAPFLIKATGHGRRQMCTVDRHGFPNPPKARRRDHFGFRTGDIARADVKVGKRAGVYVGRVAVRSNGHFNIRTRHALVQSLNHRWFQKIQSCDGYEYPV